MIDSHMHIRGFDDDLLENLALHEEIRKKFNMEATTAASLPSWDYESAYQNVLCILFKALYPHNYSYFGFDYYVEGLDTTPEGRLQQVKDFMSMGFDGLKIIEGKPSVRKSVGRTFHAPEFKLALEYAEKNNIPLLWHVADPEENWTESKCNWYVIEHGWCYESAEFPSKEEIVEEAASILAKYPNLKVTFAHFLFTSFDIDFARMFLNKYTNACFDLTPGIEMYYGFTKNREQWHDFFIEFQERIIFGTDNGWGEDSPEVKMQNAIFNVNFIMEFLTTDHEIKTFQDIPVRGLALPSEVVEKITSTNFKKNRNTKPNPVNINKIIAYAKELLDVIENSGLYPTCTKTRAKQAYDELLKLR